ncbi:hypothetical protein TNCV_2285431 [Trichonephila clavipes]|nr:hypothetical protein TNCV_2285431 [Trichonephila clavipes]
MDTSPVAPLRKRGRPQKVTSTSTQNTHVPSPSTASTAISNRTIHPSTKATTTTANSSDSVSSPGRRRIHRGRLKYTAFSCVRSDSALRSIWTAIRSQHMIDYASDSQNKSIFHRQSQYDGDMTCVCSGQATFYARCFGFPVDGPLARVVPIYRPLLSCPLL